MTTNVLDLLKKDHDRVRGLLKELMATGKQTDTERPELLATIETELKLHTTVEHEIFYPAFNAANGDKNKKMVFEAEEEHRAIEKLILPDVKKTNAADDAYAGRAKVLKELIEHHAKEEEDEMFPRARETLSEDDLVALGEKVQKMKKELKA
ncbi:MAG TPA: hemerythrin domain-containing protein [Gammaproteobacteria bacterium]|nr:hemerythrin domain-containing protein [Gammaproteobacteria bacterium]